MIVTLKLSFAVCENEGICAAQAPFASMSASHNLLNFHSIGTITMTT